MPKSRMAWSCWNYLTYEDKGGKANVDRVSLSVFHHFTRHLLETHGFLEHVRTLSPSLLPSLPFPTSETNDPFDVDGMNSLQHIPEDEFGPVLATLNPPPEIEIDERLVQGRWKYEHPVLDDKVCGWLFFYVRKHHTYYCFLFFCFVFA